MHRRQHPKQPSWRILQKHPQPVPHPIISRKLRPPPRRRISKMIHRRIANLNSPMTNQSGPISEVHVFIVTKKPLVKTTKRLKNIPPIKRRRRTRRKHFTFGRKLGNGFAVTGTVSEPSRMIDIANTVKNALIVRRILCRSK